MTELGNRMLQQMRSTRSDRTQSDRLTGRREPPIQYIPDVVPAPIRTSTTLPYPMPQYFEMPTQETKPVKSSPISIKGISKMTIIVCAIAILIIFAILIKTIGSLLSALQELYKTIGKILSSLDKKGEQ